MDYTTFGRTGLTVSTLGLGGASIGGSYGPVVDEPEALRTVQAAVDLGITFIDTAPLYGLGQSEERIGRVLADCRGRDKVILATKVGHFPPGLGYDRATTVAAVEASLARLQTDYVDLIQIHEADEVPLARAVEETLEGFRLLQAAGKVRFVGITGDDVAKLALAADTGLFDTVQTFRHYTLINREAEVELLPTAARHSMGVINGSPLGMGLLTKGDPHEMGRPPRPMWCRGSSACGRWPNAWASACPSWRSVFRSRSPASASRSPAPRASRGCKKTPQPGGPARSRPMSWPRSWKEKDEG